MPRVSPSARGALPLVLASLLVLQLLPLVASAKRTPPRSKLPNQSPKRLRMYRRCMAALDAAERDLKCALLRVALPRRLSAARKCRYNGLPFDRYRRLRGVCRLRHDAARSVAASERDCARVRTAVDTAARLTKEERDRLKGGGDSGSVDPMPSGFDLAAVCANADEWKQLQQRTLRACRKIGWTGGDRAVCPPIRPIVLKLKKIMWKGCGADGVDEARREVERLRTKCQRVGGEVNPTPSTIPRRT